MAVSHAEQKQECILEARSLLSRSDVVVLDTETTGFGPKAEIVDIAIVDLHQNILINSLVKPKSSIPADVIKIHGITNEMVSAAPRFNEVFPVLADIFSKNLVLIYNASFDLDMLRYSAKRYQLGFTFISHKCLMLMYATFRGEPGKFGSYRWHKLEQACRYHGIKPGGHRALSDVLASIELLRVMADQQ